MDTLLQSIEPRRWLKTTNVGQATLWLELNLADVVLTILALSLGFSEGNSFLGLFVHNTGLFVFYRVVMMLAVLAFVHHKQKMQYIRWLNIGMGAIVLWNIIWLIFYTI